MYVSCSFDVMRRRCSCLFDSVYIMFMYKTDDQYVPPVKGDRLVPPVWSLIGLHMVFVCLSQKRSLFQFKN